MQKNITDESVRNNNYKHIEFAFSRFFGKVYDITYMLITYNQTNNNIKAANL